LHLDAKIHSSQINIPAEKPCALKINKGGDDISLVAKVYKKPKYLHPGFYQAYEICCQ